MTWTWMQTGAIMLPVQSSCAHTAAVWKLSLRNSGKLLPHCMHLKTLLHSGQKQNLKRKRVWDVSAMQTMTHLSAVSLSQDLELSLTTMQAAAC